MNGGAAYEKEADDVICACVCHFMAPKSIGAGFPSYFRPRSDHMLAVISTIVSFQAAVEGLECAALKSAHQPASL